MLLALWSWREGEWAEHLSGWSPPIARRKTKKDIYRERVKLGIIKETIEKAAEKIVAAKARQTVDKARIGNYYRPDVADLTALLMAELRLTVKSPDYTQAIQIAIAAKRHRDNEDDEEAILLLM